MATSKAGISRHWVGCREYNLIMGDNGRPEYTDEQYRAWLDEMSPFLKLGYSLYYAMDRSLLLRHKDSIYRKFKLNDWFCEKIEAFQRYPGEIVNSIFSRLILIADEKVKRGQPINREEWRNLRFFAEKHRSCQPFFVSRTEIAQTEPSKITRILDELERETTDYSLLSENAKIELSKLTQTA